MNFIFPILVLCTLFVVCYSAVFHQRSPVVSGMEGMCFDKDEKKFFKIGDEMPWKWSECGRRICKRGDKRYMYEELYTCGKVAPSKGCRISENLALPYPDCCPRNDCINEVDVY